MSPATIIEIVTAPTARSASTSIDTAFMVGFTAKGSSTEPIEITSAADIEDKIGQRDSTVPWLYDSVDEFLREGGGRVYVGRRFGTTPVKASKILNDGAGSPAATLKVTAKEYGTYGNDIAVKVDTSGSNYDLTIYYRDEVVETFTGLADRAAGAAVVSDWVDVALNGSSTLDPATLAKTNLTGGVDDHATSTSAELTTALDLFAADLGPGQVLAPGATDATSHGLVRDHAVARNRIALLDGPDSATPATVTAAAASIQAGTDAWRAAMFGPWVVIPGPLQGQERTVPPSAVAAGLMARNDRAGKAATEPAANVLGDSIAATGLSQAFTDSQRDTLNTAGVNAFKSRRGTITLWGYRTLADPDTDEKWLELGGSRLMMQIVAQAEAVAEPFVLKRIDGKRHILVEFATALAGVLDAHVAVGSLEFQFDENDAPIPGTAYSIATDADPDNREISAVITLRIAGMAETVRVRIVRRAHSEAL